MNNRPKYKLSSLLLIITVTMMAMPTSSHAQASWNRAFGGPANDVGNTVIQTSDGGYLVVGTTESFGAGLSDCWLVKLDSLGDSLWTRTYGAESRDHAWSVIQTNDGAYLIAGDTRAQGNDYSDMWLLKIDSQGDTLWSRTYGGSEGETANAVIQSNDGGFLLAGVTTSFSIYWNDQDAWLVKTDSLGFIEWTRNYGGPGTDAATSVIQTTDGGYTFAGHTGSFGLSEDYPDHWLVKIDSQGDTLWTHTYGGDRIDEALAAIQTSDNGYLLAGWSTSFTGAYYDAWVVKTDSSGNTIWTNSYGGSRKEKIYSITESADNCYLFAGFTSSFGAGNHDFWLVKTDTQGDTLWTRTYGGSEYDAASCVIQTQDAGIVLVGDTYSFSSSSTGSDLWLVKTDADGNLNTVGISENKESITPESFWLEVFPNPFNSQTNICYEVPNPTDIIISIYDLSGRQIDSKSLTAEWSGKHSYYWNASNVNTGVYIVRLATKDLYRTRKVVVLK